MESGFYKKDPEKMSFRIQDFHLDDSKSLNANCPAGHLTR